MALLLAAAAVGAGVMHLTMRMEEQKRDLSEIKKKAQKHIPESALYQSHAQSQGLAQSGIVRRAIPDVDLRGVPHYWLDYGGGSFHKVYTPPGLLYNAAQSY